MLRPINHLSLIFTNHDFYVKNEINKQNTNMKFTMLINRIFVVCIVRAYTMIHDLCILKNM